MEIEFIKDISVLIIIGATVSNLYVVYKNLKIVENKEKEKNPVIDIKVDNLPPYNDQNEKTTLRLKNVGTKATNPNLMTSLSCSWMPSISLKFNMPSEDYTLEPNEQIIWKFRLDENFPNSSTIYINVRSKKNYTDGKFRKKYMTLHWELTEQL